MIGKSLLFELNEAARLCPNLLTQKQLRDAAAELRSALVALADNPATPLMAQLQCVWSKALRLLSRAPASPDGGGSGGRLAPPVADRRAA